MNKVLYIILISLFSVILTSCADKEEEKEGPVLTEVYPVTTPTSETPHQITLFHLPKQELSLTGVHVHQGQPLRLVGTTQSPLHL